jgi:hypothetical protein
MRNLASRSTEEFRIEHHREQHAEENTWAQVGKTLRGWRKFHNAELHNFYSSPNIIKIKLRDVRSAEHVA